MANVSKTLDGLHQKVGGTIAIVGGGFSGTMVAVHLLRQATKDMGLRILLIERSSRIGRGIAYSTRYPLHLLNVPADNMSALPEDPEHFLRWFRTLNPGADARTFAPRCMYGDYVSGLLEQSVADSAAAFEMIQGEVVSAATEPAGSIVLGLQDGRRLVADQVILALGNSAPSDPSGIPAEIRESGHYIADPWRENALTAIEPEDAILILGTGLTMVDKAIELQALGHRGKVIALSRRGLMPLRHQLEAAPVHLSADELIPGSGDEVYTLPQLFERIRTAIRRHRAATPGADWRSVVDALRPYTQPLWSRLPLAEKRRFLRHLKSYWEVHRHRTAPEIYAIIDEMRSSGQMELLGGRLQRMELNNGQIDVYFREHKTLSPRKIKVRHIINCTGTGCDIGRGADPLVADMLARGFARPDALGIGFAADVSGALLDSSGKPSDRFFTIGPLLRGTLWETTAVPELRVQAESVASRVLAAVKVI